MGNPATKHDLGCRDTRYDPLADRYVRTDDPYIRRD